VQIQPVPFKSEQILKSLDDSIPVHGKQVDPDKLVWALAALAEGLGIRAVARVFEVDPNTVLGWLVDAAEHLEAFSRYCWQDVYVEQVQMDELFALCTTISCCLTRACVCHCPSPSMGRAQSNSGSHGHLQWPLA
jgi:hypothetical protein